MCGRKTTVAEYSVVKEPAVARFRIFRCFSAASARQARNLRYAPVILRAGSIYSRADQTLSVHLRASRFGGQPSFVSKAGLPAVARFAWRFGKPGDSGAKAGGEYRARTGDLLVANQALSQLS